MTLKTQAPATQSRGGWRLPSASALAWLKNAPFGAAAGVVAAGALLWFAPHIIPDGWRAEAVVGLGLGAGMVSQRVLDWMFGWLFEPVLRHVRSRWEATIQLRKLARYEKLGRLPEGERDRIFIRIARADIRGARASRPA
jgi:hypothetical protein